MADNDEGELLSIEAAARELDALTDKAMKAGQALSSIALAAGAVRDSMAELSQAMRDARDGGVPVDELLGTDPDGRPF